MSHANSFLRIGAVSGSSAPWWPEHTDRAAPGDLTRWWTRAETLSLLMRSKVLKAAYDAGLDDLARQNKCSSNSTLSYVVRMCAK